MRQPFRPDVLRDRLAFGREEPAQMPQRQPDRVGDGLRPEFRVAEMRRDVLLRRQQIRQRSPRRARTVHFRVDEFRDQRARVFGEPCGIALDRILHEPLDTRAQRRAEHRACTRLRRDSQRQRRQFRIEPVVERRDRNIDQQLPHRRQESEQIGHARVVDDDIAGVREQAAVPLDEIRAPAQDLAREQRLLRQLAHQGRAALDHVILAADVRDAEARQRDIGLLDLEPGRRQ